MKIACCIWALSEPEIETLRQARDIGFDYIDIQPMHQRSLESQLLAQELGLRVSCVGASFGMPDGAALDHAEPSQRERATGHIIAAIQHAADIGANIVYVIPGLGGKTRRHRPLSPFNPPARRCGRRAKDQTGHRALSRHGAAHRWRGTLEFIRQIGHENLYLLYDSGHIQMSGEDPEAVIANAGDRLGYVHLDDNDGVSDLHWSLLDGVMTDESLVTILRALDAVGYQGALSLELSPALTKPARALSESRDVLASAMHRAWTPR